MQVIHNKDSSFALSLIQRIFLSRENSYELNAIGWMGNILFIYSKSILFTTIKWIKMIRKSFQMMAFSVLSFMTRGKKKEFCTLELKRKKKLFELFDVIFSVKAWKENIYKFPSTFDKMMQSEFHQNNYCILGLMCLTNYYPLLLEHEYIFAFLGKLLVKHSYTEYIFYNNRLIAFNRT